MDLLKREGRLVREWMDLKLEKARFYSPDTLELFLFILHGEQTTSIISRYQYG